MRQSLAPRHLMVLTLIPLCSSVGDIFLSRGLKHSQQAPPWSSASLLATYCNAWIVTGVGLLIASIVSNMLAFRWMDLTFVLPATATGYLVTPLLAHFWLGEDVPLRRWLGVALIICGVGVSLRGPHRTEPAIRGTERNREATP